MKLKITMGLISNFIAIITGAQHDVDVIAKTIWHEARGEGKLGMEAVATVIYNRAQLTGKSYTKVCLAPKQFSCWNGKSKLKAGNGSAWTYAKKLQHDLITYDEPPLNQPWTHYYNYNICKPSWSKSMRHIVIIGNHVFGKVK